MVKRGLIMLGAGALSVAVSCLMGMGPCGPASLTGLVLLFVGFLALVAGAGMLLVGLMSRLFRRGVAR